MKSVGGGRRQAEDCVTNAAHSLELLILFRILTLLVFGPRRGRRRPRPIAMILGAVLLLWLLIALGMGSLWNSLWSA